MTFILVKAPDNWTSDNEALMRRVGESARVMKLTRQEELCMTQGRPITEFTGKIDGRKVVIGGDLFLITRVPYAVHLRTDGYRGRKDEKLLSKICARLSRDFDARMWSSDSIALPDR